MAKKRDKIRKLKEQALNTKSTVSENNSINKTTLTAKKPLANVKDSKKEQIVEKTMVDDQSSANDLNQNLNQEANLNVVLETIKSSGWSIFKSVSNVLIVVSCKLINYVTDRLVKYINSYSDSNPEELFQSKILDSDSSHIEKPESFESDNDSMNSSQFQSFNNDLNPLELEASDNDNTEEKTEVAGGVIAFCEGLFAA